MGKYLEMRGKSKWVKSGQEKHAKSGERPGNEGKLKKKNLEMREK